MHSNIEKIILYCIYATGSMIYLKVGMKFNR